MSEPTFTPEPRVDRATGQEPGDYDELIMFLERDQLVAGTSRPVAPAHLSRRVTAALWLLRVFVVLVSFMVIYTFVQQLG